MAPSRVEWTQYPGHGPGAELFGEVSGLAVAELGCGNGDNLAPLAVRGADCVGVDVAPLQITRACTRWGHLPIRFQCADARLSRPYRPVGHLLLRLRGGGVVPAGATPAADRTAPASRRPAAVLRAAPALARPAADRDATG
ncbi:class I SAM-dependent methyltransferase [Micromonospora sp. NPDC023814]|uniref:class I SAM-dependent methyltransferase n=1 Tax=Micromonospora sp. NPDC023814 TaxID=3154596 RepID=UPI0033D7BB71